MNSTCDFLIDSLKEEPIGETDYFIWFITDNNGELNIRNPHSFSRHKMYKSLTGEAYNGISPICTAGDMLLFPADVLHGVSPTNKPEPRISISFNIIFK